MGVKQKEEKKKLHSPNAVHRRVTLRIGRNAIFRIALTTLDGGEFIGETVAQDNRISRVDEIP